MSQADHALRLAAIDVGSNSVHMIVAQADADGGVTTLWRMKEMSGLGRTSFPSRRLTREAIDRALGTLGRFKQAALQRGAEKIVAAATSAVREAANGGDLIQRAREELKLYVKVVSAREEARLIYLGARHDLALGDVPNLLIDIGGGSVEFIVGDAQSAALLESRKLGAARMTARFVKSDPVGDADVKALRSHFRSELGPLLDQIKALKPQRVVGTSGTFENLAALCAAPPGTDGRGRIPRKRYEKVLKGLLASTADERAALPGLDDHRREQVVAAALLVGFLFDELGVEEIGLARGALREGLLLDHLARHLPAYNVARDVPDPRRRAVLDLARRCQWSAEHSAQVARLAVRLFDELRPLHGQPDAARALIEYAALLHDIGWHIDPSGHHKHGQYLVLNGGLREQFAREEVEQMAAMVRYHRKREPTVEHDFYAALPLPARAAVDLGAGLIRVADGLDRSRSQVVRDVTCAVAAKKVTVTLQVRADAALEVWGAERKVALLERVLGRSVAFEAR